MKFTQNYTNIPGAIKCNHFIEVVWVDQEIIMEIKLGRLQENGAAIDGERQVVIDCIVHVSMVYGYLATP